MNIVKLFPLWLLYAYICLSYPAANAQQGDKHLHAYLSRWIVLSDSITAYQQDVHTYYRDYSIHWHARLYQEKMKGGLRRWEHNEEFWEEWEKLLIGIQATEAYLQVQKKCLRKAHEVSLSLAEHTSSQVYLKDPHLQLIQDLMQQWDGIILDVQESTRQQWPTPARLAPANADSLSQLLHASMKSCLNLLYALATSYQADILKEEKILISCIEQFEVLEISPSSDSLVRFQSMLREFLRYVDDYQVASATEERYMGKSKSQYFIQAFLLPLYSQHTPNLQQLYRELTAAEDASTNWLSFISIPEIYFPPLKESSENLESPSHWMWVVDASESMQEEGRWEAVKEWIAESLALLSGEDKVSLMVYQEQPQLLLKRERPEATQVAALWTKVSPGQKGNLPLALDQAVAVVVNENSLDVQLLLCTDGGFEINEALVKQVEKIQLAGYHLSILLTDRLTHTREQALQKIARIGGGNLILLTKE